MKKIMIILASLLVATGAFGGIAADVASYQMPSLVTQINNAVHTIINGGVTNLSAANLKAGTVATAIDGSEVTNLSAAKIKSGGVLPAVDGSAITNMSAAQLKAGSTAPAINLVNATNLPITVTKQTGVITGTGAITPKAPSAVTPTITVTVQYSGVIYDSTGAAVTNAAGEIILFATNVTASCSELPLFLTNATAAITIIGGGAVMTNATASNP